MDCPRCGLINPESAQRCDCGYDFASRSVRTPYSNLRRQLPKEIKTFLILVVVLNIVIGLLVLTRGDITRIAFAVVWSVAVYWLYWRLVNRDNWARIALVVLTFPLGLLSGLLSQEARLYCVK